jgi:hypothetical protein
MKTYQELHITIGNTPSSTIEKISQNASSGWERDTESEQKLASISGGNQFCFTYKAPPQDACQLWIVEHDNRLVVTNIVPLEKSELSISDYNRLLNHFVNSCLLSTEIKYSLSKENIDLSDILSEDSSQKFYAFSRAANKSTGHAHPLDEERWLEFIYSMVKHQEGIDPDELTYFLREDGWPKHTAFNLALDMEYGYRAIEFALRGRQ